MENKSAAKSQWSQDETVSARCGGLTGMLTATLVVAELPVHEAEERPIQRSTALAVHGR